MQSVQGIEASINTMLLAVLGLLALIRAEERIKRKRVFRELHGLRSLIHVIDMHQLTKDPNVLSAGYKPTAKSPPRITDRFELARYLDYCSEMLSITGKVAALFAQSVNDEVVIDGGQRHRGARLQPVAQDLAEDHADRRRVASAEQSCSRSMTQAA